MSALRIFTRFMHLKKLGLLFKTSISLKPEFLTNVSQAKCFIIGLIIHLKTLPKCQKRKELKKIGFRGQKGSTGRGYGQPAQPVEEPVDRLPSSGRGPVKGCTKSFSLSQQPSLPGRGDSLTGRGPVEATVTCHALNVLTASELVDPQLDRTRLSFAVFDLRAQKPIN